MHTFLERHEGLTFSHILSLSLSLFSHDAHRYSSSDVIYERGEESQRGSLFFQFVTNDNSKTVFTKANLMAMHEIHQLVVTHPKYKHYCHLKKPKVMNSIGVVSEDIEKIYSNSSVNYLDVCCPR